MQLRSINLEGFRSINFLNLRFDDVTVLIGGNNAGKSTVLNALRLFFDAAPKVSADDYYKRVAEKIEIIVTFDNLTPDEVTEFGSAVHNGELTVMRTLSESKDTNLAYSVLTKTYPPFDRIREESNKTNLRGAFNAWAKEMGVASVATSDQAIAVMDEWERSNPNELEFSYSRGFFGAPNVANGKLKKKTNLHFVPAVVNVSEETSESKKSPIISLLSDIAKQTFENREEVKKFLATVQSDFAAITSPDRFPQLMRVSDLLTAGIRKYYTESKLLAEWVSEDGVKFAYPRPVIKVEDSGFLSGLDSVGHCLQRAALFSVIEFLATGSADGAEAMFDVPQSDIILLIEEPEIYLHPHKQKIISEAFRKLCAEFNAQTGIRFQVIFATHSEKFVELSSFHSVRVMRRCEKDGDTVHSVASLSVDDCSRYFADLLGREPMLAAAFLAKLHIFSREVCEGFFAKKVILVEGVTDKAVLEGVYASLGRDSLLEGISIISVEGKTKMDKPFYILNQLGIPTFAVFDSDRNSKEKKSKANRIIQRIAGIEDPSDFPSGCFDRFCAFDINIEGYAKDVCGQEWVDSFQRVADEYGLEMSDICKTPHALQKVFSGLRNEGRVFGLLEDIVHAVVRSEQSLHAASTVI